MTYPREPGMQFTGTDGGKTAPARTLLTPTKEQLQAGQIARAKELEPLARVNADFGVSRAGEAIGRLCETADKVLVIGAFSAMLWAATRTVCWIISLF